MSQDIYLFFPHIHTSPSHPPIFTFSDRTRVSQIKKNTQNKRNLIPIPILIPNHKMKRLFLPLLHHFFPSSPEKILFMRNATIFHVFECLGRGYIYNCGFFLSVLFFEPPRATPSSLISFLFHFYDEG